MGGGRWVSTHVESMVAYIIEYNLILKTQMEHESTRAQTPQPKFHKFELVWAKITGWPWWPGRVVNIPSQKQGNYTVEFFADPSHAFLPEEKLVNYSEGRHRHSTPKSHYRNFYKALAQADRSCQSAAIGNEEGGGDYSHRSSHLHQQIQIINQDSQPKTSPSFSAKKKQPQPHPLPPLLKPRKLIQKQPKPPLPHSAHPAQRAIEALLKRYRLDEIPKVSAGSIAKKSKKKSRQAPLKQEIRKCLSRTVERALRKKGIASPHRYSMAVSLADAVLRGQEKGSKGVHQGLFQWISSSDEKTIEMEYSSWPTEQKNDPITLAESCY